MLIENIDDIKIPECLEWKELMEKYKCNNCKLRNARGILNCEPNGLKIACDCKKRFGLLKVILNIFAILIIFRFYFFVIDKTQWYMLSVCLTVVATCIMDFFFVIATKMIRSFFTNLEKERLKKYEVQKEEIIKLEKEKKAREEEIKKQEEAKFFEVNKAKELLRDFEEFKKQNIGKIFPEKYKNFCIELNELCNILVPESFRDYAVKHLFEIHLLEFKEICQEFSRHCKEGTITEKEKDEFINLLDSFKIKLAKIRGGIQEGKNVGLRVKMNALNQMINSDRSEN